MRGAKPEPPCVLVVDDEPFARKALERELSTAYRTAAAPGAAQALRLLAARSGIAAVVTDLRMSDPHEGLTLLEQVRELYPLVLRVLVAGSAIDRAIETAIQSGLVEWLIEKPWSPGEIVRAIRRGLTARAGEP